MKLSAKNTGWLLPLLLTGCFHHARQAKNVPLAPPLPPAGTIKTVPVELPPDANTIPPKPTEEANIPAHATPKPPAQRRRPAQPAQPKPTEEAAITPPPAVSALGQLSSGDPVDFRRETAESIMAIEKGLNGINRQLSSAEQKTADHIREFLKEARQALATGDVDGAHTLAVKAKVLLAELTQ